MQENLFEALKEGLTTQLNMLPELQESMKIPKEFCNPMRHQYISDKILNFLFENFKGRVLAITDEDLYTENLNFVFGQARLAGSEAIVSTHRLDPKFYRQEDQALFTERVVKECIHEVAHMLGLKHCSNSKCVMNFSNTIADVDKKSKELCESCKFQLRL